MHKYPPLFRKMPPSGATNVHEIENLFEEFWRKLSPMVQKNSEKTQAMRKLQEACMWLSRASAIEAFNGGASVNVSNLDYRGREVGEYNK